MRTTSTDRRKLAVAIAKDLIEGGIDDPLTVRITAKAHRVTVGSVRLVRRIVCKNDVEWLDNSSLRCSMVDAIANGWEDTDIAKIKLTWRV